MVSTAVAGNRLLFNSAGPTGPDPRWGQNVLTRFDGEVLSQAGAQVAIVWIGLNDLANAGAFYPAPELASVDEYYRLHPNTTGGRAVADSIDLRLLR